MIRYVFNGFNYIKTNVYFSTDSTFEKHLGISAVLNDSKNVYIGGAIKDIYNQKECGTSYVFRH